MASYNEPNGGKKSFSNNPYNNLSNNSQNVPNVTPSGGSSSYNNHKNINYGKIALLVLVVIAIVCVFKMCSIDQGSSNNGIAYTPSIAQQTDAPTVDTKPIDTQLTDIQPNKTQSTAPSSHKGLKRIITSPLDPEILDLTFEDSETQEFNITVDDPGVIAVTLTDTYAGSDHSMYLYDKLGREVSKDHFSLSGNDYGYAYDLEAGTYTLSVEWNEGEPACKLSVYFANPVQDITILGEYGMITDNISAPYMKNVYTYNEAETGDYYFTITTDDNNYNSFGVEIKDEFGNYVDEFCVPYGELQGYLVELSTGSCTIEVTDTSQAVNYSMTIEKGD